MTEFQHVILLGSEHPEPQPTVRELAGALAVLSAGAGPHHRPKTDPNEDSVLLCRGDGWRLGALADAHYGAAAGERWLRHLRRRLESQEPASVKDLSDAVLEADQAASRLCRDQSESTLAVALQRGRTIWFVNVGDSLVLSVDGGRASVISQPSAVFGGGSLPLRALMQHPRFAGGGVVQSGEVSLPEGAALLLATDGLLPVSSALSLQDVAGELSGAGGWVERVHRLAVRASQPPGGRDNLALVVLPPP